MWPASIATSARNSLSAHPGPITVNERHTRGPAAHLNDLQDYLVGHLDPFLMGSDPAWPASAQDSALSKQIIALSPRPEVLENGR
jgi:hypothetical protein